MLLASGALDRTNLVAAVSTLLGDGHDFVLVFRDADIKPSLCFGQRSGIPTIPDTIRGVEGAIAELRSDCPRPPLRIDPYDLYLASGEGQDLSDEKAAQLSLILSNFLFNNISFFNHIEDVMYEKLKNSGLADLSEGVPDYDAFASLISHHFNVYATIQRLTDGNEEVISMCRAPREAIDASTLFRTRAVHAVKKGQVIEIPRFMPNMNKNDTSSGPSNRYIFPLRSKSRAVIRTNEFLVATPCERAGLSLLEIFSINQWVEEYTYARTRRGQQQCLYWQTREITRLIESVDNSRTDLSTMFVTYMGALADLVIASTQGHSFAYLSYDAAEDALTRLFATFEPTAGEDLDDELAQAAVPLSAYRQYVSAFLFCSQANEPTREIYIPAIAKREEYAHLGLQTVTCRRNQMIEQKLATGSKTRSEAAFIVHDQGVPVGVICVECPHRDGLRNDLDFLRQVSTNASIYRSFLFRIGDQRWLRRNLKLQDVSHELEKLQLVISDTAARERLKQITRELELTSTERGVGEPGFEMRRDCLVREEAGGSDAITEELADLVRMYNPPEHQVPPTIQMAVIHIVRILLRNRVHASTPHPITVVTRDAHAGVKNALIIKTVLELNVPQSEIEDAFRQPIRRADREHVGLYMIGVVVRAWGGRLDFDRRSGVARRKLEICIPFARST